MNRAEWPPGGRDGEGRSSPRPATVESRVATTPPITNSRHRNTGDVWREGFGHGFRDALRLACREVDDPAVWLVLNELAERYALAAGDL
jgi:hypothetical protein